MPRILFALPGLLAATSLPPPIDAQAQSPPDASSWTIGAQPMVVVGSLEGDAGGEFAAIVDVVRGPDGTLAVVDDMLSAISFHAPEGALVAVTGRRGEGPGEFQRITSAVADLQGRLFVFDWGHQRITEFSFDGTRVGDTRLIRGPDDRRIGGIGRFAGGSWYAWEADQILARYSWAGPRFGTRCIRRARSGSRGAHACLWARAMTRSCAFWMRPAPMSGNCASKPRPSRQRGNIGTNGSTRPSPTRATKQVSCSA